MPWACQVLALSLILILWPPDVFGRVRPSGSALKRKLSKREADRVCDKDHISKCSAGVTVKGSQCVSLESTLIMTKTEAEAACRRKDRGLLTIDNIEEEGAMDAFFEKDEFLWFWTSMNDREEEGNFTYAVAPSWYNGKEVIPVSAELLAKINIVRSKTPDTDDCVKISISDGQFYEANCEEETITYCSDPGSVDIASFAYSSSNSQKTRTWEGSYEYCKFEDAAYPKGQNMFVLELEQYDELQTNLKDFATKIQTYWLDLKWTGDKWVHEKDGNHTEANYLKDLGKGTDTEACAVVTFSKEFRAVNCTEMKALDLCTFTWEPYREPSLKMKKELPATSGETQVHLNGSFYANNIEIKTHWSKYQKSESNVTAIEIEEKETLGEKTYTEFETLSDGECVYRITKSATFKVPDSTGIAFVFHFDDFDSIECTEADAYEKLCQQVFIDAKVNPPSKHGGVNRPPNSEGLDGMGTSVYGEGSAGSDNHPTLELRPGLGDVAGTLWAGDNINMTCFADDGVPITWLKYTKDGTSTVLEPGIHKIESNQVTNDYGTTQQKSTLTVEMSWDEQMNRYSCFSRDLTAVENGNESSYLCDDGEEDCTNFPTLRDYKGNVTLNIVKDEANGTMTFTCAVKYKTALGGKLVWYYLKDPDCRTPPLILPNSNVEVNMIPGELYEENEDSSVIKSSLVFDIGMDYADDSFKCFGYEPSLHVHHEGQNGCPPGSNKPLESTGDTGSGSGTLVGVIGAFFFILFLVVLYGAVKQNGGSDAKNESQPEGEGTTTRVDGLDGLIYIEPEGDSTFTIGSSVDDAISKPVSANVSVRPSNTTIDRQSVIGTDL